MLKPVNFANDWQIVPAGGVEQAGRVQWRIEEPFRGTHLAPPASSRPEGEHK